MRDVKRSTANRRGAGTGGSRPSPERLQSGGRRRSTVSDHSDSDRETLPEAENLPQTHCTRTAGRATRGAIRFGRGGWGLAVLLLPALQRPAAAPASLGPLLAPLLPHVRPGVPVRRHLCPSGMRCAASSLGERMSLRMSPCPVRPWGGPTLPFLGQVSIGLLPQPGARPC
ncbi:hypothetical protein HJG60_009158 [Phyllostomus discolor]|uniref:Uncharacterized protein n=1 Tax=Phyllostomus discolor TaxID=89673 RepID=A0A833YQJ6_9CHIR|nr:hypothetical protein HJG60_009158 [Phyllostomus discolor]